MIGHQGRDFFQRRRAGRTELAQRGAPHHHVFQGQRHFLVQGKTDLRQRIAAFA
jgi:hypothetical protein